MNNGKILAASILSVALATSPATASREAGSEAEDNTAVQVDDTRSYEDLNGIEALRASQAYINDQNPELFKQIEDLTEEGERGQAFMLMVQNDPALAAHAEAAQVMMPFIYKEVMEDQMNIRQGAAVLRKLAIRDDLTEDQKNTLLSRAEQAETGLTERFADISSALEDEDYVAALGALTEYAKEFENHEAVAGFAQHYEQIVLGRSAATQPAPTTVSPSP